jgi:signal transduction histidine kinase/CheY-like chemotaxis protein
MAAPTNHGGPPIVVDKPHHVPRRRALYESRREREFYRYYEPIRALTASGPPICDLFDQKAVQAHRPFSSPDPALTAFCQLGALRLGTRRAMLFFFDSNYAYVLAEATRTLSLKDDSVHEIEDKLWLGHAIIPRGFSICEDTVCRLPSADESSDHDESSLIHIINDLEKDTEFCDRPYVTDGPKARFYAGVPITTPKGIKIGAYCLLDDKIRPGGLDEKGRLFLTDMASTVMKHLEACRAKAEHLRGTRMVTGLGAFIEGASSLRAWEEENQRRTDRQHGKRASAATSPTRPKSSARQLPASDPASANVQNRKDSNGSSKKVDSGHPSEESVPQTESPHDTRGDVASESPQVAPPADVPSPRREETGINHSKSAKTSRQADDFQAQLVAENVRNTFQRAADLVREAVDVEGAVFLDAAVGTYGGLVEAGDGSDHSSDALFSGTDITGNESELGEISHGKVVPDKLCKVLASSHTAADKYHSNKELQAATEKTNITERFLKSLLRRYGHGKIWNFNEVGDASSDDESSESSSARTPLTRSSEVSEETASTRKTRRKRNRIDDGREIQRLFPGVRSLALVGMWDQSKGRWFSACAVWTYSPLRLFSPESELSYLAAFCDVTICEIHRLEAQNADRAKSDFISSISHELRSPLHGILGSVECLQEQPSDAFSAGLISQIEICGRTLLDIVDHLLDYSKVNHLAKARSSLGDGNRKRISSTTSRMSQLGGLMSLDTEVCLDEITEEVVETAVYSFCCSRDKQFILNRKVAVILDVDRSIETSWRCRVPLGGWKRICINLVSNALKYTAEGFIRCNLRAEPFPVPGKRRRFNVVFEVKDSGRGMSKEFLENHLFKAFSQEDSLMEGTGLGMSLVAKIVKAMGGKIEVQSEKGVGTMMTVTVPLDRSRMGNGETATEGLRTPPKKPFEGYSVGLVGFQQGNDATAGQNTPDPHSTAKALTLTSVQQHCEHLGVKIYTPEEAGFSDADMFLVPEQGLATYQEHMQNSSKLAAKPKPLIVLCASAISARQLRAMNGAAKHGEHVEYIAQPCSTVRLTMAVKRSLGLKETLVERNEARDYNNQATGGATKHSGNPPTTISRSRPAHYTSMHLPIRRQGTIPALDEVLDEALLSPKQKDLDGLLESPNERQSLGPSDHLRLEEHLAGRSKSTGAQPDSPFPLDPVSFRKASSADQSQDNNSDQSLSLLLVDDNAINLQLLTNYAKKQGHRKITATDGEKAVEAYKAACLGSTTGGEEHEEILPDKPSVILMDINMPNLNGFEATRQIRAFEKQHGLQPAHIVALTGLGSASAQQEAFSSGVDLFLTKPVRLRELTKLLDDIRKAEREKSGSGSGDEKGGGGGK